MNQPYSYPYYPSQPPPPPPRSKSSSPLVWVIAAVALFLMLGTCGGIVGLGAFVGFAASLDDPGGVQMGAQVSEVRRAKLRQRGLIDDRTQLVAFYDASVRLDLSEVALITTEHVVYAKGDKQVIRASLAEIRSVDHRSEVNDVIDISSNDGTRLKIEVAPFNGGMSFLNALEDELHKRNPGAVVRRGTPR